MTQKEPSARPGLRTRLEALLKNPEVLRLIRYVVIGGLTTAVNFLLYVLFTRAFGLPDDPANMMAIISAIIFAYITNKIFVFRSHCRSLGLLLREMGSFFAARALTAIFESVGFHVLHSQLGWNDLLVKAALTVVVLILNYAASKLVIFRHADKREERV